jgi:hypothetical protein
MLNIEKITIVRVAKDFVDLINVKFESGTFKQIKPHFWGGEEYVQATFPDQKYEVVTVN